MYTYYISVGSNIGNRRQFIMGAYDSLSIHPQVHRITSSSVMETEPWGYTEQDVFLNAVWRVSSSLEPHDLLDVLQSLECEADGACMYINDARLVIPHPYFWDRLFVLEPLMELDKAFTYNGESIGDRIQTLKK